MTEKLPISIYVCDELQQQFVKICSVCNKLEAQFNFQTMIANWYGDEDNILAVQLHIEVPARFSEHKEMKTEVTNYSDDVFSYFEKNLIEKKLIVHISITEAELILLNQKVKLLSGLLGIKLEKVLNLIAKQLKLSTI